MTEDEIEGTLAFLAMAERLKDTLRTGHTTAGGAKAPRNIAGGSA